MDLTLFTDSLGPIALGALQGTIPLAVLSFAFGLVLAVGVALARMSSHRWLRWPARALISVVRGTPLLVQLFVIFYGLPNLGWTLNGWTSAVIAFTINVAGYGAETIRAAILSVPRGQW
ncbi:MAG: ABC transporter permease subunit, partial [Mycetocola sp.]